MPRVARAGQRRTAVPGGPSRFTGIGISRYRVAVPPRCRRAPGGVASFGPLASLARVARAAGHFGRAVRRDGACSLQSPIHITTGTGLVVLGNERRGSEAQLDVLSCRCRHFASDLVPCACVRVWARRRATCASSRISLKAWRTSDPPTRPHPEKAFPFWFDARYDRARPR